MVYFRNLIALGVCEKNLSCHSCLVHITEGYENLDEANEEEQDVHDELGDEYIPDSSRMACQTFINSKMDGMKLQVPRAAFAMFRKL